MPSNWKLVTICTEGHFSQTHDVAITLSKCGPQEMVTSPKEAFSAFAKEWYALSKTEVPSVAVWSRSSARRVHFDDNFCRGDGDDEEDDDLVESMTPPSLALGGRELSMAPVKMVEKIGMMLIFLEKSFRIRAVRINHWKHDDALVRSLLEPSKSSGQIFK